MTDIFLDTAHRGDPIIDIHPMCEAWEDAYREFGAHAFLTNFMSTDAMVAEIIAAAKDRGVHISIDNTRGGEFNYYHGDIKVRGNGYDGRQDMGIHCQGCLFWPRHYVGSFLAKKLHEDGVLLIHGESRPKQVLHGMHDFLNYVRSEMRKDDADYIVTSITHGSIWHTVAVKYGPDLDEYPMADAKDWCGDLLWTTPWFDDEFKDWHFEGGDAFIGQECRHGIGHGVFYAMALKSRGLTSADYDACMQYRPYSWTMPWQAKEEADQICETADGDMIVSDCKDGVSHSYELMYNFDWSAGVH